MDVAWRCGHAYREQRVYCTVSERHACHNRARSGPGGGSGGGILYDFDGVPPINVSTTPGTGSNPTIIETSMDIQQLDDRTK